MSRRGRPDDLENCINKFMSDLVNKNVVSSLVKAFISCFSDVGKENYISIFERYSVQKLYEEFKCEKISGLLRRASLYIDDLFKEVKNIFDAVFLIKMELVSRLSIQTRDPMIPFDISIAWDPILNLPYIPSSSLKGVVRSYVLNIAKINKIDDISVYDLFGRGGRESSIGALVFFDAYPVACMNSLIEPEVITPHYKEAERKIDETSSSPVPIVFPTIASGTIFNTIIAIDYSVLETIYENKSFDFRRLIDFVKENIIKALDVGVGAKTNLGYGRIRAMSQTEYVKETNK